MPRHRAERSDSQCRRCSRAFRAARWRTRVRRRVGRARRFIVEREGGDADEQVDRTRHFREHDGIDFADRRGHPAPLVPAFDVQPARCWPSVPGKSRAATLKVARTSPNSRGRRRTRGSTSLRDARRRASGGSRGHDLRTSRNDWSRCLRRPARRTRGTPAERAAGSHGRRSRAATRAARPHRPAADARAGSRCRRRVRTPRRRRRAARSRPSRYRA